MKNMKSWKKCSPDLSDRSAGLFFCAFFPSACFRTSWILSIRSINSRLPFLPPKDHPPASIHTGAFGLPHTLPARNQAILQSHVQQKGEAGTVGFCHILPRKREFPSHEICSALSPCRFPLLKTSAFFAVLTQNARFREYRPIVYLSRTDSGGFHLQVYTRTDRHFRDRFPEVAATQYRYPDHSRPGRLHLPDARNR